MGPGDRIEVYKIHEGAFAFGIFFDRFPYDYTLTIALFKWNIKIGFGKPYTEYDGVDDE